MCVIISADGRGTCTVEEMAARMSEVVTVTN